MKAYISLFAILLVHCSLIVKAQNGLRDIPDTSIEAQLESFRLPAGAKINLFASEPMINKPLHMNWDSEGRLWVCGSSMYPHIEPGSEEVDKLYLIEDTDGDGVADSSSVFADDLHIPSGVLPGDGGVYVANSTELLFLKDTDGDGKADERQIMLSGFGTEDTHHLLHTPRWGPEGMMWLNQSIYIHTHLETPYGIRRLLGGGMWHYRPETQRTEVFMKGLVNPWGHAFDDWGQSLMTDGAGGEGINFVFPRSVFKTSPGASRTLSGLNPGQPKHCGLEVLSGSHIPEEWRGTLAAPDFRGHRINRFRLSDDGTSAFTSSQLEDLVSSSHRAFRPIDVKMGPDGAIYIADWYNPIIQHGEVDFRDPRRDHTHGRIWRISFEDRAPSKRPQIKGAPAQKLAELIHHEAGWVREQVTAELRTRKIDEFEGLLGNTENDLEALRNLWAHQTMNSFDQGLAERLIKSSKAEARAAGFRALYYEATSHAKAKEWATKAIADPHPRVRLWAVSVLAQLPDSDTVAVALQAIEGLPQLDDFLDFAVWSICREHASRWVPLVSTRNPFANLRQLIFAARALNQPVGMGLVLQELHDGRIQDSSDLAAVSDWVARSGNQDHLDLLFQYGLAPERSSIDQKSILQALSDAEKLRKLKPKGDPARLSSLLDADKPDTFPIAATLAGQWKMQSARPLLEKVFQNAEKEPSPANAALAGLESLGGQPTLQFLRKIASDADQSLQLRSMSVRGVSRINPKLAATLALPILQLPESSKDPHQLFDTFLSNKQGTVALSTLLNEEGTTLPRPIAQLGLQKASAAATRPEALIKALQRAGNIKPMKMTLSAEEMEAMIAQVTQADPARGEAVYRQDALQCIVCHAIGGAGGIIGPDLVSIGSSAPVDYLVESLLEPSKKIKEGYHTTLVTMKNGDSFSGAIASENNNELVVRDVAGNENRLPKRDIKEKIISPVSLMPPGLTMQLREDEFADLVKFLSELGKDGAYKTPANRYIRKWETLLPHERTRDAIGHYGKQIFAEDFKTYQWRPVYAKVAGGVPVGELPQSQGRGRNRYGIIRSFVKTQSDQDLRLKVSGKLADISLFLDEDEVALPEKGESTEVSIELPEAGQHKITAVGLSGWGLQDISVEVLNDASEIEILKQQ